MFIPCLTIAGVCAASLKKGRRDDITRGLGKRCMLAKNADHDMNS